VEVAAASSILLEHIEKADKQINAATKNLMFLILIAPLINRNNNIPLNLFHHF